jgi:hypothetical protein
MTANNFNAECLKRTIAPAIAIENENIREALREKDDESVLKILDTEF